MKTCRNQSNMRHGTWLSEKKVWFYNSNFDQESFVSKHGRHPCYNTNAKLEEVSRSVCVCVGGLRVDQIEISALVAEGQTSSFSLSAHSLSPTRTHFSLSVCVSLYFSCPFRQHYLFYIEIFEPLFLQRAMFSLNFAVWKNSFHT